MRALRFTLLMSAAAASTAVADQRDFKSLHSFLSPQSAAVVAVDIGDPKITETLQSLAKAAPDAKEIQQVADGLRQAQSAGVKRLYLVVEPAGLKPEDWCFAVVLGEGVDVGAVRKTVEQWPGAKVGEKDGALVVAGASKSAELADRKSSESSRLLQALKSGAPSPLVIEAVVPDEHRRTAAELMPILPESLGGGSTASFLDGFVGLGVRLPTAGETKTQIILRGRDAESARKLADVAMRGLPLLLNSVGPNFPRSIIEIAGKFKPEIVDFEVRFAIDAEEARALADAFVDAARSKAKRSQRFNDLRQVALGMHNYLDANRTFPPGASVDKAGKPLLSWRVHILPFLDQKELYSQFKLDEPWDSDHNRKLIEKMPKIYSGGIAASEGKTVVVGFSGVGTLFPKPGAGVRLQDVTDGTSNTLMAVLVPEKEAVVWTKPQDLDASDASLLAKLGAGEFIAVFCDGSVRAIPIPNSIAELLPYITIAGGEVINH